MRTLGQTALAISLALFTLLLVFDTTRVARLEKKIERSKLSARGTSAPGFAAAETPSASIAPLATIFAKAPSLQSADELALESALERWIGRIADLKSWLNQQPEIQNPELKLLSNRDWYFATLGNPLATVEDFQRAYRIISSSASVKRQMVMATALNWYSHQNGIAPTDVNQLVPYLTAPLDEEILRRYEISGGRLRYK